MNYLLQYAMNCMYFCLQNMNLRQCEKLCLWIFDFFKVEQEQLMVNLVLHFDSENPKFSNVFKEPTIFQNI